MSKAYLEFGEWSGPATQQTAGGNRIEFQFNPSEFSVQKQAEWVEAATGISGDPPPPQYIGPKAAGISVEMFLDASDRENGDVTKEVQQLLDACLPTSSSEAKSQPLPPKVRFGWDRVHFEGYVESINAQYTLFREDGRPVRAKCTISLKETPRDAARQNPTSGTPAIHRSVETVAGDTLASIAYREYGDPTAWREIATANRIDDPMRMRPGVRLLLPPLGSAGGVE